MWLTTEADDQSSLMQDVKMKVYIAVTCVFLWLPSVLWRCWLGGRKGIWPVKNRVVRYWHGYLSGARCKLAYGPADATATVASVKSRLVYLSGTGSPG